MSRASPGRAATLREFSFFNAELTTKRLELLRTLVPSVLRIAVLLDPTIAAVSNATLRDLEPAARAMGMQIQAVNASTSGEINTAFASFARERVDAFFAGPGAFFLTRRVQLAQLAARHGFPAIYSERDYVDVGGLMSYGTNITDAYRQVGVYTGRILKGAKPADLPVLRASKFELIINAEDRPNARPDRAADPARDRRRGDRMVRLAALHESGCGTSRHFAATQQFGRFRSEADVKARSLPRGCWFSFAGGQVGSSPG